MENPPPPLRTGPDVTAAAATAADATMQPTMVAPASPVPLQPPPASARSSGVPALLTPGATASLPPSLSSASSSLSALSSSSPTPPSSTAAIVAATTSLHAGASVSAPSPDFSSYDPAESTAASAGISLKPALAGNLAATTASQAQLGQPLNHRASGTRARATQLLTRLPDPPPATVHELVHQPGTVWGFVEKLTSSQDRARDPGPCAATEPAKTGLVSPMAAELQWTPRLLVLSDTGLYLFSTTHDPYSQPALDALRLGPGSSLRIVADPGSPSAVILTVSNESREWDLRCTPLMPAAPTTTGARDAEAAAAVADPARAPVPDLETQAWSDRLRAAIQLGRSRSKSDVLRRANLEHAIGTAADAAAAAAAAAIANSQPHHKNAHIGATPLTQHLLDPHPRAAARLFDWRLAASRATGAVDTAASAAGVVASLAAVTVSGPSVCNIVSIIHLVTAALGAVSSFVLPRSHTHADSFRAAPPEHAAFQQRSDYAVAGPEFRRWHTYRHTSANFPTATAFTTRANIRTGLDIAYEFVLFDLPPGPPARTGSDAERGDPTLCR
ncbi:hypothetical protein HK405_006500 [Cladochytrium tenue]|nr:hypothetical protein HK405_006500 [Cladochytrium tenue]